MTPVTANKEMGAGVGNTDSPEDGFGRERPKMTDSEIARQLAEEREAMRLAKSRGRVAKMLAFKSGAARKMPLSGKDAMRFILSGR